MVSGLKRTPSLIIAPVSPSSSLLLPPSANTGQEEQFQVSQNTLEVAGVRLNRKDVHQNVNMQLHLDTTVQQNHMGDNG